MTVVFRQGKRAMPRRVLLYGQHGIGKSTWAASAKGAVFIDVEGGTSDIECQAIDGIHDVPSLQEAIAAAEQVPGVRWLVFDTVDWVELLIQRKVCEESNTDNIALACGGFGKGFHAVNGKFEKFLAYCDTLRAKGIGIIMLAHADVRKVEPPGQVAYQQYAPALREEIGDMLMEWCDDVLFATTRVFTKEEDQGFGKTRNIAVGGEERVIFATQTAAAHAKNRLGLPKELPMNWADYAKFLTPWDAPKQVSQQQQPAEPTSGNPLMAEMEAEFGNIAGIVTNGSSKAVAT